MRLLVISLCLLPGALYVSAQEIASLPDAPSVHLLGQASIPVPVSSSFNPPILASPLPPCTPETVPSPSSASATQPPSADEAPAPPPHPCVQPWNIYDRFADSPAPTPMTVGQKGKLALYDIFEPVNLMTIAASSALGVGVNSHSAYGPGFKGWGRSMGYSFVQDATGELIGTFAISSITHEDPRYHRDPHAPTMKRVLHAISHTFVAQHDDGRPMPNYRVLIGYPLCAETSDLYVPGIATDAKSTFTRVGIGIAAHPVEDLITEFLPDVVTHVHLRVLFVSRVLNHVAAGQPPNN